MKGKKMGMLKKDMDIKNGLMELSIEEIGLIIYPMELGNLHILMEIIMRENGKMEWHMEKEHLYFQMEQFIKVIGLKINSMEKDHNQPKKEYMKESLLMEINKEGVHILGKIALCILDNGNVTP